MKFKEGDRVKVKDSLKLDDGIYAGKHGFICEAKQRLPYPYRIQFDDTIEGEDNTLLCLTRELEREI